MKVQDTPPPYELVVFDCDSTLSSIEGIEELGRGYAGEFVELTNAAMNGELPLEAVYGRRLELARPTRDAVEQIGQRYVETALPNARALVAALRGLGKRVAIVSGGVRPAVAVLGEHLGVDADDVHAVDLRFDDAGAYAGFDESSPLARQGGKPDLLGGIAAGARTVLVGDGATDLEAAAACARFVAFGGVVRRKSVFDRAAVGCEEADFAALLPLLLATGEIEHLRALPDHADLMHAAGPWL